MYEAGVGVAFLLWAVAQVRLLVALHSQLEMNLRKVGLRHSWLTMTPKPASPGDWPQGFGGKSLKFALLSFLGLVGVLLSWLSVAAFVWQSLHGLAKDWGAPVVVREMRWRLRNQGLTKELIAEAFAQASPGAEADRMRVKALLMESDSL